ncbi:MAG: radical SAM family heme chaperone HemW [Candidatus Sericytochromatia bacterium]|nr:radical SAM family heme chaperone HemW [Candidatus Sericytochromatia bacterium]
MTPLPGLGTLPDHRALFPAVGLYLHFPFCARKCLYCDFPSYAGQDDQMAAYLEALGREIAAAPRLRVRSIFLGGGTPSYMPGAWMARVMAQVFDHFVVEPGAEVTMEANPGNERLTDASAVAAWRAYRAMGINRVSLGVQSFDPTLLTGLGRIHSPQDALDAVTAVRAAGFERISIDLMYGLPGQTPALWRDTLRQAVALDLPHLSAYSLIIEPHTPFEAQSRAGKLALPREEDEREMAAITDEVLSAAGYTAYEVSNWARAGATSRHNEIYWCNEPWLGLGSGAHSYLDRRRWANPATIPAYLKDGPTLPPAEPQTLQAEQEETMFMGLRLLREGVGDARFRARFGLGIVDRYAAVLAGLRERGLVEWDGERLRLSAAGVPLANEVFAAFLDA